MKNIFDKVIKTHGFMCLFLVLIIGCSKEKKEAYVKKDNNQKVAVLQQYYSNHLGQCITELENLNKAKYIKNQQDYYKKVLFRSIVQTCHQDHRRKHHADEGSLHTLGFYFL